MAVPANNLENDLELLAPAGDWEAVRAAVENGADAVYFGLNSGMNARARATNFATGEVARVIDYLHQRGVRGYVTLNTLLFSDELDHAEGLVRQLVRDHVDAVLVQDLGLVRLIRAISPDLPIHASTQMTITTASAMAKIASLGIERVVLPRELSIAEIAEIHEATDLALEAFVHGALCVAYSGQCLTSESLGGRSANRGQCAQACRLPYTLLCDGREIDLGEQRFLLSPQDLAAYHLVPDLLAAGVTSFKIEGRLKTAEYVANITSHYRRAIDTARQGNRVCFAPSQVEAMEMSFSRGFSTGWLQETDHKKLVPAISSAKRGVRIGRVTQTVRNLIEVELLTTIRRGDGIGFETGDSARQQQGGRLYEIFKDGESVKEAHTGATVQLGFAHDGTLDLSTIEPGVSVWKTDDPQLTKQLRESYNGKRSARKIDIDIDVTAAVGERLRVDVVSTTGVRCVLNGEERLAPAEKHPIDEATLRAKLGRLGNTLYRLRDLTLDTSGDPMVPHSLLGAIRRQLVTVLDEQIIHPNYRISGSEQDLALVRSAMPIRPDCSEAAMTTNDPKLHILCRTLDQLEALVASPMVARIYAEFQDIREYAEATSRARDAGCPLYLATPRIEKPNESGIFRALDRHGADGILARNLSSIAYFGQRGRSIVADFSLNTANELTATQLLEWGVQTVVPSYDLNRDQLHRLLDHAPAAWFELVLHQQMPMFHMEHCVYCAVLSPGKNKTDCGRPCDVHEVRLRDRVGAEHPLRADVGCRNTLYNAQPQSAAESVPAFLERGVRSFRIELLEEESAEANRIVSIYHDLLQGAIDGREVWRSLRAMNRVGVTRGTLEHDRDPLAIL